MNDLLKDKTGKVSSKRVFGAIGLTLTFAAGIGIIITSLVTGNPVDTTSLDILKWMGGSCTVLLSAGTFEQLKG